MQEAWSPYHRKLLFFLGVATFFEGYDFLALTQLLPNLQVAFHFSESKTGLLVAIVNAGTLLSYLLIRKADQWGRRKILNITIIGYTCFTLLTGFSQNIWQFAIFQLFARLFLIGEWAISFVIAAEEFPAKQRGLVIGLIQAFSSLGSVACAGLVPALLKTPFGWRSVYFVGVIPLILLTFMRRDLQETKRFTEKKEADQPSGSIFTILTSPYRKRLLLMSAAWFLTYINTQNVVTFFKVYAIKELHWTDRQVGNSIVIAALAAMPMVFLSGKILDAVGRRIGTIVLFGMTAVSTWMLYSSLGYWQTTLGLVFAIFGVSAVLPILNSYNTELFPTKFRSDSFAWANNLLGRQSYLFSPLLVGYLAERYSWGTALRYTALFPLMVIVLVLLFFPETNAKELEETAEILA
jgi:MFS transporter, putative metabolite:H+ symporter